MITLRNFITEDAAKDIKCVGCSCDELETKLINKMEEKFSEVIPYVKIADQKDEK